MVSFKEIPLPIHEQITNNNIATRAFIRYLLSIWASITRLSINETIIKSITKSSDIQAVSQVNLVDATDGEIIMTMPNPSKCFKDSRSLQIGISKIDNSRNRVIILPFKNELIVGDTEQDLRYMGEILNFITDGTNWYLGS